MTAGVDLLRILIVEDEALVAMEIEGMIEMMGHEPVGHADDLASAIESAESAQPDLALVDIQLSRGSSGLDVAAALKERGVPVMFVTGNCPTERGRGLALGCLHKPITDRSLGATLGAAAAILEGRSAPTLPSALHLYP